MSEKKRTLAQFVGEKAEARFTENAEIRRELNAVRAAYGAASTELERAETELEALNHIYDEALTLQPQPGWLSATREPEAHRGTLVAFLSDLHAGEVVRSEEMSGYNAYNLEIASARLERFFDKTMMLARDYLTGVTFDGIVLALGGDLVSGDIHDELTQTNELSVLDTTLWVAPRLVAGIERWAEEFGAVHVVSAPGNHGRDSKIPRAKGRSAHNADTHIAKMAAMFFAGANSGAEVTFDIPESFDVGFTVYAHAFSMEHGDNLKFSGTSEIGSLGPVKRGTLRKANQHREEGHPFDINMVGHFHQLVMAPSQGFVMNGCFPAGALVSTPDGPVPIEHLVEGAKVLGGDGSLEVVTNTFEREADALVHLHVRGLPAELVATPNHLVWAMKGEATRPVEPSRRHLIGGGDEPQWVPADFLSAGDWVHVPRPETDPNNRPIGPDLAWLYGLYLAEGHATLNGGQGGHVNRIGLSMHRREEPILRRAAQIIATHFPEANAALISLPRTRPNSAELVVNGREIALRFAELFGKGAANKCPPRWFLTMAPELQSQVVTGWIDGDGHTRPDGVTSATTISPALAWGMFYMGFHTGRFPSMARIRKGGPRIHDTFTIHMNAGQEARMVGDQVFYRVQNRFRTGGPVRVFDLEVSGEHTYIVGGVKVHNSVKGFDEYARSWHLRPEPAQQALVVVTPEHAITTQMPVIVGDRDAEHW